MALLLQIQRPGWYQGVARECGYSSTMAGGSSSHPLVVVVRSLCNACIVLFRTVVQRARAGVGLKHSTNNRPYVNC